MPSLTPEQRRDLRRQLAGRDGPGYWQRLRDWANADDPAWWQAPMSRRQTLRLIGASLALAGLSSCTPQPEEHLVPYVRRPENRLPGRPRFYATAMTVGGYAHGVLAESHEGRPTRIEGNPDHPATLGACDAIAQAEVLSLYDPDRSRTVRHRGAIARFDALLADLRDQQVVWDGNGGRGLCLITGPMTSPSEIDRLRRLLERWPEARWFQHDPVDRASVFEGSRMLLDRTLEPRYRFDRARVVVSLDADFLQAQPGFLRHAHDLAANRRPRDGGTDLTRLYALESTPGPTGAVADHRRALSYPEIEAATRQLAIALGLDVIPPPDPVLEERWVRTLAADLKRAGRRAVLVPGDQQPPAVHALAQAMNDRLGAVGGPVEWMTPVAAREGARPLGELTEAILLDEVSHLVVLDCNPAFTAPADLDFADRMQRVPWRLHWGRYRDETGRLAHWHVPAAHPLEAWADARAFDGTTSLVQPLIRPLHDSRTALQLWQALLEGEAGDAHDLLRGHWQARHDGGDFERFWRESLRSGVIANTAEPPVPAEPVADWADRLPPPRARPEVPVLQLRPDPALWDGRHANNGWLQEMPRPITTLTWDNALLVSPEHARDEGWEEGDRVTVGTQTQQAEATVYVLPGHARRGVTLHLGQGHRHLGRVANGVGDNAYALRSSASPWALPVSIVATGGRRPLAAIQRHHAMEGRDLIRAATVDAYRADPAFARDRFHDASLYPEPWPGDGEAEHAWGMSIDLSACIGCNACVTACQGENNIPVVGPDEVRRGHDLHWIRVDRYFAETMTDPATVFQPVPCMHCENAPCEYVCPVGATLHSADGLNQMIYQRCVGTRYCSQNCPYKVRRFNWFDYTGANAPYPAEPALQNPDVTVRSRGVMEKCTYCVQRIQRARLQADAEDRPLRPDEPRTACQQACPTRAIVFGDLAEPRSEVARLRDHPLSYALLGHLNTRPRTTYLAAVRNPNPALTGPDPEEGGSDDG